MCIVVELAEGGSLTVATAVCVALAVAVALTVAEAVALGFIGFSASVRTCREI